MQTCAYYNLCTATCTRINVTAASLTNLIKLKQFLFYEVTQLQTGTDILSVDNDAHNQCQSVFSAVVILY